MNSHVITQGLTLFRDGTWMKEDDLPVKITKLGWKERIYFKGKQYFTHYELAKAFVPNPDDYDHVVLIDWNGPINADNLKWIKHPGLKMDQDKAKVIRSLVESGSSQTAVAKMYGVSRSMIHRIIKGERW